MSARSTLEHGNRFPYDASDAWWDSSGDDPPEPVDWAHSAARGVLADLTDRRGIKHELANIDEDVRIEIVDSLAAIIRAAHAPADPEPGDE